MTGSPLRRPEIQSEFENLHSYSRRLTSTEVVVNKVSEVRAANVNVITRSVLQNDRARALLLHTDHRLCGYRFYHCAILEQLWSVRLNEAHYGPCAQTV